MYVLDATPPIYLSKVDQLGVLDGLERDCTVPEPVHEEVVVTGLDQGYADARRIERAVEGETLAVVPVEETDTYRRLCTNERLSDADAAVLSLADEADGTAVMDEQYGRAVAEVEGIETRGTAYLVLRLARDGAIEADEARRTIDAMVDAGWYCAPDLYARILERIESLS